MRSFNQRNIYIVIYSLCFFSCQSNFPLNGNWKVATVRIFDSYYNEFYVDLSTKYFYYDSNNIQTTKFLNPQYKDSVLFLMSKSYLRLNDDSTFQLYDHGFFTQALSDTLWQGKKAGIWNVNLEKSILTLYQSNRVSKQYKIIALSKHSLTLGELSVGEPKQITETTFVQ